MLNYDKYQEEVIQGFQPITEKKINSHSRKFQNFILPYEAIGK